MVVENTGVQLLDAIGLETLTEIIRPLFLKVNVLVGGIFGLYLILILVRVYYERKKVKLLRHIRYDLDQLNQHNKVPSSREQQGWMVKIFRKIKKQINPEKKSRRKKV